MDEPLSNLDAALARRLSEEILRLHAELTGSGEARVYGNPEEHAVSRNGSGTVNFED